MMSKEHDESTRDLSETILERLEPVRDEIPNVFPLDKLQNELGAFGMYQFLLLLVLSICKFPLAYNQLAIVFIAPNTKFTCANNDYTAETCPCVNPKYETSTFPKTLITEYDLICDRRWLRDLTQSLFQFGTLTGSVLFGMASDRFGRRKSMLIAVGIQIIAGFISAIVKNFWLLSVLRYLVGVSGGGVIVVSFVVMMEYTGAKCRETITLIFMTAFIFGKMTIPVISYFARAYDTYLITIGVINCVQLCYICLMPETARWYLSQQKKEKAIQMFEKVRKRNKKTNVNVRQRVEEHLVSVAGHSVKRGTICDVFRRPVLRKHVLVMGYNWFTGSFCYYGIAQYMGQLGGNVFVNVALSGVVTLIGLIIGIPITKRIGRKAIVIGSNIIAAACILATIFLQGVPVVICACIGEATNFYVFAVEFLYGVELFPTVVRNSAMGMLSMIARIGSMIAPFVVGLEHTSVILPKLIFGCTPLLAAIGTLLLPETMGLGLTSTLEEGEMIGKKRPPTRVDVALPI